MSSSASSSRPPTDLDSIMKQFKLNQQVAQPKSTATIPPLPTTAAASHPSTMSMTSSTGSTTTASNPIPTLASMTLDDILRQHRQPSATSNTNTSNTLTLPTASSTTMDLDSFLSTIQRHVNVLLDGGASQEQLKATFESLTESIGTPQLLSATPPVISAATTTGSTSSSPPSKLPPAYSVPTTKLLLKPLLKRFNDTCGWCRSSSIRLVTSLICIVPQSDLAGNLHYILPTIALRMGTIDLSSAPTTLGANTTMHERGSTNPNNVTPKPNVPAPVAIAEVTAQAKQVKFEAEQTEEIRAELLQLLYELCLHCTSRELEIYLPDICQIIYTSMENDANRGADLKILLCQLLIVLCQDYPQPMRAFSKILLIPFMRHLLLDKVSRVRVVAVRALGLLIPCGAAELIRDLCAFREHNIIDIHGFFHGEHRTHYLARLVADSNIKVRLEFFKVINDWCLNLYERADYETLIMPYVFSGLSEQDPEIQAMGIETMRKAGREFEREEKERLASGIGGNASDEGKFQLQRLAEEKNREYITALGPPLLFPPFTQRPPWGERQIARKFLDRLLHAILSERGDWKEDVADRSWRLLRLLLVYAEEHITQFCGQFLKAFQAELMASQQRKDKTIGNETMWNCMALIGRYTDPLILLESLTADLKSCNNSEKYFAQLRMMNGMVPYLPWTYPGFAAAFDTFLSSNSLTEPEFYLSVEWEKFKELVNLFSSLLLFVSTHPLSFSSSTKKLSTTPSPSTSNDGLVTPNEVLVKYASNFSSIASQSQAWLVERFSSAKLIPKEEYEQLQQRLDQTGKLLKVNRSEEKDNNQPD